jgi:hypothetical protein
MLIGKEPPAGSSYQLIDGRWVRAVAAGGNRAFQNGIVAAGNSKATAFQLPAGVQFYEVDTVAASAGVLLPAAKQGQWISVFNNGANALSVYGRGTDTINAQATATALSLVAPATAAGVGSNAIFYCAKDGAWAAVKG